MKLLFLLALLFSCRLSMAQKQCPKDSADFYLDKLDSNAVTFNYPNHRLTANLSNDASMLFEHANKYIIGRLIDSLQNNSKLPVFHILLSKLLDPTVNDLSRAGEDLTTAILFSYQYNGLSWSVIYDKTNLSTETRIDAEVVRKIKAYWKKKLLAMSYEL